MAFWARSYIKGWLRHDSILLGVIILNYSCVLLAQANGISLKNVAPLWWLYLLSPWHSVRNNKSLYAFPFPKHHDKNSFLCGCTSALHPSLLRGSGERGGLVPSKCGSKKGFPLALPRNLKYTYQWDTAVCHTEMPHPNPTKTSCILGRILHPTKQSSS